MNGSTGLLIFDFPNKGHARRAGLNTDPGRAGLNFNSCMEQSYTFAK